MNQIFSKTFSLYKQKVHIGGDVYDNIEFLMPFTFIVMLNYSDRFYGNLVCGKCTYYFTQYFRISKNDEYQTLMKFVIHGRVDRYF